MMFGVIAVMVFDRKSYFLIFMIAIKENMIEAYFATDYSIDTTLVQEYTIKDEKIVRYQPCSAQGFDSLAAMLLFMHVPK